jgi:hypothetical protein
MEPVSFDGGGSVPGHIWPHFPQNSIGCGNSLPSMWRVLEERQTGQEGTSCGAAVTVTEG